MIRSQLILLCVAACWIWCAPGRAAENDGSVWDSELAQNDAETQAALASEPTAPTPVADKPASSAPRAADAQSLSPQVRELVVTVVSFEKNVQVRANESAAWERPIAGMKLSEGAEVRTGLRSRAVLHIEPGQTVVVDRLSSFKVVAAYFDAGKNQYKTNLGMEYGRVRYDVQAGGLDHDSKIDRSRSLFVTLGIRGIQGRALEFFLFFAGDPMGSDGVPRTINVDLSVTDPKGNIISVTLYPYAVDVLPP